MPPALAAHMDLVSQFLLSQWLNSQLSDEFAAEFQSQMEALQKRCQLP